MGLSFDYLLCVTISGFLTIAPNSGPMLGGQYVIVSRPCIEDGATISVIFNSGSPQKCERKSEFSLVCITPMFTYTGDAIFLISIEVQGVTKTFIGLYKICKYLILIVYVSMYVYSL